ncbi:MAG TPA: response regulator [Opitutaceae bacterium]|nr:response regulator [Opitutaceae bacterium]
MLATDLIKTDAKILVADDDIVSRKVLTAFLEKSNYEVVTAVDGPSALEAMLAPEAPCMAILDWMMPGMDGTEVCARIRAAGLKIRPYVIMLTAKTAKDDLAASLDAGADDYLTKPYNSVELLARLRVAQRTIHYQLELQKHIDDLELMAERYRLLGEIISQQGGPAESDEDGQALVGGAEGVATTAGGKKFVPRDVIDEAMVRALGELSMEIVEGSVVPVKTPHRSSAFTAWAGLLLGKAQLWIDLLLEIDREAATAFYEQALRRRPVTDREILGFLAETHTIVSAAFKAALQARGGEASSPMLSHALRTDRIEKPAPPVPRDHETHTYNLEGFALRLTLVRQPCLIRIKMPNLLNTADILAEPYPSSEVSKVPLINQGVVLNDWYIEKLIAWADKEMKSQPVHVFQPSPLAKYFYADTLFAHPGRPEKHLLDDNVNG